MNPQTFTIKTEVFEGPLDLLLSLVEKRKLFVNDIALAAVTEDYLAYINKLPEYSLNDRTEFIVIASTLLLIKARSLLPNIALTEEEKGSVEDLERRLKELEIMRRAGAVIKDQFGTRIIFPRGDIGQQFQVFAPSKDITGEALSAAVFRVLQALPKKVELPKVVVKKVMSLEEMIGKLTTRINDALKMSFREFSKSHKSADGSRDDKVEKVHVIISFLAMLELVKQGSIDVRQDNMFDEIEMESQNVGVPRY